MPAYSTLHNRVRTTRGRAAEQQCVRCSAGARDWATIHGEDGTDPWADYVPMCRRCHFLYDMVGERRRGTPGPKGVPVPANRGHSHNSKLGEDEVRAIRALIAAGDLSLRAIGRKYGVAHIAIARIRDGHHWDWLA